MTSYSRRHALSALTKIVIGSLITSSTLYTSAALAQTANPSRVRTNPAPTPIIMVYGDSLSAEYGLRRNSGWVTLLDQRIQAQGGQYKIVNASISGETTAGGASRMIKALQTHQPNIVLIELGANDALRGLALSQTRSNLLSMIKAVKDQGAKPMLIGMRIPPNYGRQYSEDFFKLFEQVAREQKIAYVPFLLDGIADQLQWFQADRIHPNEAAQSKLLDNVWPGLKPLLKLKS